MGVAAVAPASDWTSYDDPAASVCLSPTLPCSLRHRAEPGSALDPAVAVVVAAVAAAAVVGLAEVVVLAYSGCPAMPVASRSVSGSTFLCVVALASVPLYPE